MSLPYGTDHYCDHGHPWGECCQHPDARYHELLAAILRSDELDKLPTPQPLIDGLIYLDSLVWLQGRPGSAKSLLALDWAANVSIGHPWQGYPTANPGEGLRVLYVVAEAATGLRQRRDAWQTSMGLTMQVDFLPVAVQADIPRDWDAVIRVAAGIPYSFILFDTQARVTVGMDENSARDMGKWVAQLERVRDATGACVTPVHHQGRTGEHMRGSSAMEGAATTIAQTTADDNEVTVKCLKQKDAALFDDINLRLVPYEGSVVLMPSDGRRRQSDGPSAGALKTARTWSDHHGDDWVTASKLVDVIAPKSTIYRHVKELERAGMVRVNKPDTDGTGYTRYRLDWDEGRQ
jgi:hypothetical protein